MSLNTLQLSSKMAKPPVAVVCVGMAGRQMVDIAKGRSNNIAQVLVKLHSCKE